MGAAARAASIATRSAVADPLTKEILTLKAGVLDVAEGSGADRGHGHFGRP